MKKLLCLSFITAVFISCSGNDGAVGDDEISTDLPGKLVFQSDRTGDFEIFATANSGTGITNLSEDLSDDLNPSLSRDGGKLLFTSERELSAELYLLQGSQLTKINSDGKEYHSARLSRRGNRIVFVRNYNIYLMNSDGTGVTQLTFNSGDTLNDAPCFSYDDSKIAFTRNVNGGNADIMLMNGLGGTAQNLTGGIGDNTSPAFSPDGNKIVFSRNNHISVITIATKIVTDLMPSDSMRYNGLPVFSPDGNTIAFVTNRTGNMEIFSISTKGQSLKNLTENKAIDTYPYWSE